MKKIRLSITSAILALTMVLSLGMLVMPDTVSAADVVTKTVNIAEATKNERGPGYDWANRYDILTLTNLHIETNDAYGLRLPKNATVVLKGDNYIKAAKYGISFSGTVIFKGSGSLTIEAGEIGLYLISQDSTQKIRLIDGKYTITAGTYGVYSDYADFSFVDGEMDINVTSPEGKAIQGRVVNLLGGRFKANAPVESTHALVVEGINLDITASTPALVSKNLSVRDVQFSDGSTEYADQTAVVTKSTAKTERKSAVFGDSVPGWVDYILLAAVIVGIGACIFVPALRRKKKTQELYARLAAEGYITEEK
ncbi:MAG: hypothetical protein IJ037_04235 [Clostridia bacterium]|nr:hypothetical protein [Clostridia bacterium]